MTTASPTEETFDFQTEARQLLQLMVHSLYSNKEVFLRELISNASDAADRLRFEAILAPELLTQAPDLAVVIDYDEAAGTLSISDNGIGMSRQEVIDNLGTIARSGTARFLEALTGDDKKDAGLIGQFGVGFYSAFIVAERVEVTTRRANEPAENGTVFRSEGQDNFILAQITKPERGTQVVLYMRPEAKEFLNGFRLRQIIRKYADHLSIPVRLPVDLTTMLDAHEAGEKDEGEDSQDDTGDQSDQKDAFETINSAEALWTRPKQSIEDEEYEEFYKLVSHSFEPPLIWSHNKVEGKLEYTSLLFLPKQAPFDLYNRSAPKGLKLYVNRVFIMDDAEQFLPLHLRFVRGIVDSGDLPLNVSRELLQEDERVQSIRQALTRRVTDMIARLAEEQPDKYAAFWQEFGPVLKEGLLLGNIDGQQEKLQKILRFPLALQADDAPPQSLADYVKKMPAAQDKIYYLLGDNIATARQSPHLEIFKAKNQDVLVCCDGIDAWGMVQMEAFEGKKFQDITRADLGFDDLEDKETASADNQTKANGQDRAKVLVEKITTTLGDRIAEVRVSKRLTDSPACLVLGETDLSARMRQLIEATTGQAPPESRPILEINPGHPLVNRLHSLESQYFDDMVFVLFDQAFLMEGAPLPAPATFVQRMNRLLAKSTDQESNPSTPPQDPVTETATGNIQE